MSPQDARGRPEPVAAVSGQPCACGWTPLMATGGMYTHVSWHRSMSRVKRVQRRRTAGWRMPEGAVYVGRPTRWGNPFDAGRLGRQGAVDAFRIHVAAYFGWDDRLVRQAFHPLPVRSSALDDWLRPLRAATALACWCALDEPCHADVLIDLLDPAA